MHENRVCEEQKSLKSEWLKPELSHPWSFQIIEICNLERTTSSFLATSEVHVYKKQNAIFTKNWVTRFYRPTDAMWAWLRQGWL